MTSFIARNNTDTTLSDTEQVSSSKKMPLVGLSWLDTLLPVWIFLSMLLGVLLSYFVPSTREALDSNRLVDVSLPIFIGLLWMMYPVLCKVKYEEIPGIFGKSRVLYNLGFSFVVNWIIAPLLMTALAWMTLPDLPDYRVGVILVGVARCIAMVLIWNQLANGDPELCAILVAVNSIFQIILFSPLAYFLMVILGGSQNREMIDMWLGKNYICPFIAVTRSVLIFLGVPLLAGILTRFFIRSVLQKKEWYDKVFLSFIGPTSLVGLLFTIIVMFTLQGNKIVTEIGHVFRVAVPLVLYFFITFFGVFFALRRYNRGVSREKAIAYEMAVTQAFTAAGNNFELAIAVAIATFGIDSSQALATVIGPLIEVPVLVSFVYIAKSVQSRFYSNTIAP